MAQHERARTTSTKGGVLDGHRFGSNLPRKASNVTSIRTPTSSDLQTDHDQPFDQELRSFRHVFPPVRRASSAGRALQLTREEMEKLRDLASSLLADVLAAYATHVNANQRQAHTSEWKSVKKRDHLVVVKQRLKGWSEAMGSNAVTPTMMAFGTIAGQLDDLLYGLSSETTLEMKLHGSCSNSALHDAAVLTAIESATTDEPLCFLGVKWVLQSFGSGGSSSLTLMKKRDLMYLESTGVTTMPSGEHIGHRILHSVNFKSMAHLSENAVRAKVSICQVFRQRSDGKTLDVFMRGYYDPSGGRVSQMLATSLSAEMMLQTPSDALECANLKKLAWCAKQSGRRRRKYTAIIRQHRAMSSADSDEMRAAMQEMQDAEETQASSQCRVCHRDCDKMLRRSGSVCMVCSQVVCTRCSVVKKLSFAMGPSLSSDALGQHQPIGSQDEEVCDIRQKALTFCLHCIVSSNRERAIDVAVSELEERGVGLSQPADAAPQIRQPMSSTNTGTSRAMPSSTTSRSRQSTVWQRTDDRYSQFPPTPQGTRRRATTTSGKHLTTVLTFNGLTPSEASGTGPTTRPTKAFSAAGTTDTSNEYSI